jgi:hypothetical protein
VHHTRKRIDSANYNHNMLALLLIDHRIALVSLAALLIAAAIPLAYAWATLLPDDPPPFPIEPGSFPAIDQEPGPVEPSTPKREVIISVALLACVTLMYLIRFPGFPNAVFIRWLDAVLSAATAHWLFVFARVFLITAAGAAILYAVLRRSPVRIPLATAAALVLLLWFLAPLLRIAFLTPS